MISALIMAHDEQTVPFQKPTNLISAGLLGTWNTICMFTLSAIWLHWNEDLDFITPLVLFSIGTAIYTAYLIIQFRRKRKRESIDWTAYASGETDIGLIRMFIEHRETLVYYASFAIASYLLRIVFLAGYILFSPKDITEIFSNIIGFFVSIEMGLFASIAFILR